MSTGWMSWPERLLGACCRPRPIARGSNVDVRRPRDWTGITLEVVAVVLLVAVMIGSAVAEEATPGSPEPAPTTGAMSSPASRDAAHEARLRLYEDELRRLTMAEAQASKASLDPSAFMVAIAVSSMLTTLLTLLTLRVLESLGLWRRRSERTRKELDALEKRVMTGLREFDGLLTQLMSQAKQEVESAPPEDDLHISLADERLGMESRTPVRRPSAIARKPSSSPAAARRKEIMALARQGVAVEEIGRRMRLGPGEVKLILKLAGTR